MTRHEYPALWPPSIRTPALHVLALSRLYLTVVLKRPIGLAGLLKYLLGGYGYATGLRMNARSRGERDGLVLTWARLKGVSTSARLGGYATGSRMGYGWAHVHAANVMVWC